MNFHLHNKLYRDALFLQLCFIWDIGTTYIEIIYIYIPNKYLIGNLKDTSKFKFLITNIGIIKN